MNDSTPAVVCRDLRKRYVTRGQPPVDTLVGVDLTAEVGEYWGLLGPNGAGKTVVIAMLIAWRATA